MYVYIKLFALGYKKSKHFKMYCFRRRHKHQTSPSTVWCLCLRCFLFLRRFHFDWLNKKKPLIHQQILISSVFMFLLSSQPFSFWTLDEMQMKRGCDLIKCPRAGGLQPHTAAAASCTRSGPFSRQTDWRTQAGRQAGSASASLFLSC